MNAIHQHSIDICNRLLREELSATETYTQVIDKYDGKPASELERIRNGHFASAERLRENISDMGGIPSDNAGTWGLLEKGLQGIANLFGPDSAMEALQRGEETARETYEEALKDGKVLEVCKITIRNELLRRVHRNIASLEMMSHGV